MKDYHKLLIEFYSKYNPEKIAEIPGLLEKYKGQEEALLHRLYEKYKVVEQPLITKEVLKEPEKPDVPDKSIVEVFKEPDKQVDLSEKIALSEPGQKSGKGSRKYLIAGILVIAVIAVFLTWKFAFNRNEKESVADENPGKSEVISAFIKAEDNRQFEQIYSFFSPNLRRYYNLINPDVEKLRKSYETVWGFTSNPRNQIEEIIEIDKSTYDVLTTFSVYNQKKNEELTVKSKVRFIFDNEGKIIELYDIESTRDTSNQEEIVVNPQNIGGDLGQVTFYQEYGKALFYFEIKPQKGKIVVNEKPYEITELSFDKNSSAYHLSGDQIEIHTSEITFSENSEGTDCEYGKCELVTVIINGVSTVIKDVQVQDCPSYDSEDENSEAATIQETSKADDNETYFIVEEMPIFPGGEVGLREVLAKSIEYPVIAQEKGIQGKVYVTFIVDKNGGVTDAKVVRSIDPALDAEALRVVNSLKGWTPGKQRGKPVRVSYTVPISFILQ